METVPEILIIGAGVIGLSTAILLQQQQPTAKITIVASEFPTPSPMAESSVHKRKPSADYASMWAGAHYRPIPGSGPQLTAEAKLCAYTVRTMKKIAKEWPDAGVAVLKGVEYFEVPTDDVLALKTGQNYTGDEGDGGLRVLGDDELPFGSKSGIEYETYCVNVHIYCRWLLERFTRQGGKAVEQKLSRIEDALSIYERQNSTARVPMLINCSGRNFDQDPKVSVIRGQTVLVKNQYHATVTKQCRDGSWSFLIPRPLSGGTIVGGTKEIGDQETEPRASTRLQLLQAAVANFPDFVDEVSKFDVVQDNVGRRPWREGGARIEFETLKNGQKVIHGYGAGGRGYEISWGVAAEIAHLFSTLVSQKAKL